MSKKENISNGVDILKNLNPRQKEAVKTTKGPLLILAGPGSGKTRVLTYRIAFLIQKGVNPQNILAVTFTNKAAEEMKTRVVKLADSRGKMPFMGTFHAFCLRILKKEIGRLKGYKSNFIIYDEADQLSLIKKIIKELQIDKEQFKPAIINSKISSLKNELINWQTFKEATENYFEKIIAKVYENYQKHLKKANALDFDDLIMLTVEIFDKFPQVLQKYQEKFKYILVDECLPCDTPILLGNGDSKSIGEIVKNKERVSVLTFNPETQKQEIKPVIGWKKTPIRNRKIFKLTVAKRCHKRNRYKTKYKKSTIRRLICTSDHKIYANGKFVPAKQLRKGDVLQWESSFTRFNLKVCNECKKVYRNHKMHEARHKAYPKIVCPQCGKMHKTKYQYTIHLNKHKNPNYKRKYKLSPDGLKTLQQNMKTNNPMFYEKIRSRAGKSRSLYWAKLPPEERDKKLKRFINLPVFNYYKPPTSPEKIIINFKIPGLTYSGKGNCWVTLKNGKHKCPDFIYASKKKVIEVADFEYWHTKKEMQKIKKLYSQIGFGCLVLDAKKIIQSSRKTKIIIEKFLNDCPTPVEIIDIQEIKISDKFVYDINIADNHNFYANGILVHNCQDTNHAQYVLINLLAKKYKNICVVGDDAQCLPKGSKILTAQGHKPIEKISSKDSVISASGFGRVENAKIDKIYKRKYQGKLIQIKTKTNKIINTTPNHIVFGKLQPKPGLFYIYLMYRKDKGFRIGYTQGVRGASRNGKRIIANGLSVRANQEAADKIWILEIANNLSGAVYKEQYYAFKYGIPTTVFYDKGRNIKLTQKQINNIYSKIDTEKRAKKLMDDLALSEDYPHHRPKGITTNHAGILKERKIANIVMFGEERVYAEKPWHAHRISLMTTSPSLKKIVKNAGFNVRASKKGTSTWRVETSRKNYKDAIDFVKKLACIGNLEIYHKARLSQNKNSFNFMPASHLRKGMLIPVYKNGKIEEEEIKSIDIKDYNGFVYDLNIENLHNYIAHGLVVHNSIYAFRGADFRNILNFERDYPKAKTVILDQNYRSTQNILDTAHKIISKNTYQKEKKLWTENPQGKPIIITEAINEIEEAESIIQEIKNLQKKEGLKLKDFTILYRINAQSRALEEGLIRHTLPYKIIGATKFYQRKEIKDILAYLKLILYPNDLISLERIAKIPPKKAGEEIMERAREFAKGKSLAEILNFILKETKYKSYLEKKYNKEYRSEYSAQGRPALDWEIRWQNIQELFTVINRYDNKPALAIGSAGLQKFLEDTALLSEADEIEYEKNLLNLMTLHAAKGLEFPVVFIAGCEDGVFPHNRSLLESMRLEEERRLCYVGITRAKKYLYLSFARRRTLYGITQANPPSRFLGDIPKKLTAYKIGKESEETIINI